MFLHHSDIPIRHHHWRSQVTIVKFQDRSDRLKGMSFWRKATHYAAIVAVVASMLPLGGTPAHAMFGTKTLTIQHMHTGESATITFARGGRYDQQALDRLNWLLRDWRTDEPIKMDPRLFDLLYEVYESTGSRQPIRVVSAYRSPKTNSMLRRRSKAVAEHSQHMLGKAMDFYLTDVSPEKIRTIAMKMQNGGVGYYPRSNTPFIHLDVGSVRAWPRMTRAQLSRLFPDGKTVHLPADGRPLPGYEEARSMILARGGKVAGAGYAYADAGSNGNGKRKSFWATLFGGRDEEEDEDMPAPRRNMLASRNAPQQVAINDGNAVPAAPAPARIAVIPPVKPEPQAAAAQNEPVPLPPVRQIATVAATPSGPQMVWQAGAPGSSKSNPFGAAATGSQIALAPNGGHKSAGEDGIGIMTYAPLPPSRPGTAIAALSKQDNDPVDEPITTASIGPIPVPPVRPSGSTATIIDVAALPVGVAARDNAKPPASQKQQARVEVPVKDQSEQTKTVAAKASLHMKPINPDSGGFRKSVYADLSTSQFTGPAVKAVKR